MPPREWHRTRVSSCTCCLSSRLAWTSPGCVGAVTDVQVAGACGTGLLLPLVAASCAGHTANIHLGEEVAVGDVL